MILQFLWIMGESRNENLIRCLPQLIEADDHIQIGSALNKQR